MAALTQWLGTHTHWLLILNDVEEEIDISSLLSAAGDSHIILTTRSQDIAELAYNIQLRSLPSEEGALLLLRKAHFLALDASS